MVASSSWSLPSIRASLNLTSRGHEVLASFDSGRPKLAPAHILAATQQRYERVRRAHDSVVESERPRA